MPTTTVIADVFDRDAAERRRLGLRPLTEAQQRGIIGLAPTDHRGRLWPNEIQRMVNELRAAQHARARAAAVAALAPRPAARPAAAPPAPRPANRPSGRPAARPTGRRAEPDPRGPFDAVRPGYIIRR